MAAESTFQKEVIKAVKRTRFCKCIKYNASAYGEKGTPDLIGCYKGMMFLLELKGPKGKATEIQELRIEQWRATGAAAAIVKPGFDLEEWLEDEYAIRWIHGNNQL